MSINHMDNTTSLKQYCNAATDSCLTYGGSLNQNLSSASGYDTALIFLAKESMENEDIAVLGFGPETDAMVTLLATKNRKEGKKTVVILNIPGAVIMPWKDLVDAIIVDFYGGE
jgi:hypothetical protein